MRETKHCFAVVMPERCWNPTTSVVADIRKETVRLEIRPSETSYEYFSSPSQTDSTLRKAAKAFEWQSSAPRLVESSQLTVPSDHRV